MLREQIGQLKDGDRISVEAHRLGQARREGEVVAVLGEPGDERCLVRWEDGHETIVYPGPDIRVEKRVRRGREEVR